MDDSNIISLFDEFGEVAELKAYATSQYKTILQQQKKINELELQVRQLQGMVEKTVPLLEIDQPSMMVEDEETIARLELRKLRDESLQRTLTFEEVKKLDILAKVLNQVTNKPKKIVLETKNKTSDELLAVLEGTEQNG